MRSWRTIFWRQCRRELQSIRRQPRLMMHVFLLFIMMLVFFPFTLPASPQVLHDAGVGFIWVAALFSVLLSSERLFQQAYEDGVLEQAFVSGGSPLMVIYGTLFIHLICLLIPMILFLPIMVGCYALSFKEGWLLAMGLLAGVPSLALMAALAAALNVGRVQKNTFMALLVLPLVIPVMVLGSGMVRLMALDAQYLGLFALLSAFFLLCLGSIPVAIMIILKLRFED